MSNKEMNEAEYRTYLEGEINRRIEEKLQELHNPEEESEEECEECKLSVGVGMALNVCNTLNYKDCDKLYDEVIEGKKDMDEVVDILIARTEEGEEHEMLKEVKRMMHTSLKELEEENNGT